MVAVVEGGATISVGTSREEVLRRMEAQVLRAQRILKTRVEKDCGHRAFAYIRFHNVPQQDVVLTRDDFIGEVKIITVQRSLIFRPEETQLGILLGNEYCVLDWDWKMTPEEERKLIQKQVQNLGLGWKWRRGSFIEPR